MNTVNPICRRSLRFDVLFNPVDPKRALSGKMHLFPQSLSSKAPCHQSVIPTLSLKREGINQPSMARRSHGVRSSLAAPLNNFRPCTPVIPRLLSTRELKGNRNNERPVGERKEGKKGDLEAAARLRNANRRLSRYARARITGARGVAGFTRAKRHRYIFPAAVTYLQTLRWRSRLTFNVPWK